MSLHVPLLTWLAHAFATYGARHMPNLGAHNRMSQASCRFCEFLHGGFPKFRGAFLRVPIVNTDYSIFGSILGPPYLGKLPHLSARLKSKSISYKVIMEKKMETTKGNIGMMEKKNGSY